MDRISKERRSWNMSRITGENTVPERSVRSALHRAGLRFRLHQRMLPGRPDIVLTRFRTVIFVRRMSSGTVIRAAGLPIIRRAEPPSGRKSLTRMWPGIAAHAATSARADGA